MSQSSRLPARPGRSRPASMIEGPMNSLAHFSIANSNSNGDSDPKCKAKRRSLLPQFSRKPSNDAAVGIPIAEETSEDGGSNERRSGSETSRQSQDVEPEGVRRKALDEDRRTMPPPASRLSRPTSMIPPRGASANKVGRGHATTTSKDNDMDVESARADSLAALTGGPSKAPSDATSGVKRTGSTRLPQSPRPGAPSIPSRTTSAKTGEGLTRMGSISARDGHARGASTATGGTSVAEKRSSAARQRPQSIVGPPSTQDSSSSQISPPRASATARVRPGSQMLPPSKPAFNTFQQHYSPAKQSLPKPPLPSSKTSRTAPLLTEDEPVSFDIAKQQIELLQLSLLHQASAQCSAEFAASAKRKLGRKHTKLRKEYESIRATELVHQRALNLAALESWCSDPAMLIENLQILSLVYSDLEGLTEEGSRHAEIVNAFERWIDASQESLNAGFTQPLSDDWHNAHSSMALKLRSIQRNLGVLRHPERRDDASALETVLTGCKSLVDGMLKELDLMAKLEKEVLAKERTRVEDEVRTLVLDDVGMTQAQQWVPVWGRVS